MQLHLNTYGTYLHVKEEMFEIKIKQEDGSTKKTQVAAHKVKSIWIGLGIALSSDAVKLALTHNIDMVFLDFDGKPLGRFWHSKLGSTTKIRRQQLVVSDSAFGLQLIKIWLTEKIGNQINFYITLKKHRAKQAELIDESIEKASVYIDKINALEAQNTNLVADQLRAFEGNAGRIYFQTLSKLLPKQYQFEKRSFRPAEDVFNAFLNYAYGILYARVERALILAGLDPYVGILHRDDYNYKSMVYDFIEPFRIFAEAPTYRLFSSKKVKIEHTEKIENGFTLVKPGKELLVETFNQYLEGDKVRYKNKNQSRYNIMQQKAHELANQLLQQST